jgi:hypothetical protein
MASDTRIDYSQLPYLRQVLAPELAILPTDQIRARMEAEFGEGSADSYDNYLEFSFGDFGKAFSSAARDVGSFVSKAAPAVATVGGGALQGALSGAQFGLPGIIAGAAAGGVGAGLSKYGSGTAKDIGGALTGITGLAGQFSPLGRVGGAVGPAIAGLAGGGSGGLPGAAANVLSGVLGAAGGGGGASALGSLGSILGAAGKGGGASGVLGALGSALGPGGGGGGALGAIGTFLGGGAGAGGVPAALGTLFGGSSAIGQLASLLGRPEFGQALAALKLGPMGRKTIPVGSQQTPVPTTAFANLAAQLADQIATEAAGWSGDAEADLSYMMNQEGEYVGDPSLGRDRAASLWNRLNEAQAERVLEALITTDSAATEPSEASWDYADYQDAQDQEYYDTMDLAETYALSSGGEYTDFAVSEVEYE